MTLENVQADEYAKPNAEGRYAVGVPKEILVGDASLKSIAY